MARGAKATSRGYGKESDTSRPSATYDERQRAQQARNRLVQLRIVGIFILSRTDQRDDSVCAGVACDRDDLAALCFGSCLLIRGDRRQFEADPRDSFRISNRSHHLPLVEYPERVSNPHDLAVKGF